MAVPPGSRDSTSVYKKSTYVRKDGRNDKRPAAKRHLNYVAQSTPEMNTFRTNNLGGPELRSLGRGFLEEQESIYSRRDKDEEQNMLSMNHSIKSLLEELKTREVEQKDES